MSIDKHIAARVASLSRIAIEDDALDNLTHELNSVLNMINRLQEVDVTGVEPMTSVLPMNAPLRKDIVNDGEKSEEILQNAPLAKEGFFAVPKVVE